MATWYELMHIGTANMIGVFPTESDALDAVTEYIAAYGPDAVREWAMARTGDDEADDEFIAQGQTLADLATREHAVAD